MNSLLFFVDLLILATARQGFGPTDQEWGYVTVRPGAHMFWWLHQTSANVQNYTDRPLIIWLQGGPGSSSTGFGNFAELGPLDFDLNPRNTTWIQYVNVLFVDNPVGTGYSYTDSLDALASSNRQVAEDFLVLLQEIYRVLPELNKVPLYIFSESYGGKMTVEIALVLDQAIKSGVLDANLMGIGLGDSWISPLDSVLSWGPYLLNLGIVDQNGFKQIQASAQNVKAAFDSGNFTQATSLWSSTEALVSLLTQNVEFYNVLTKVSAYSKLSDEDSKINALMNGKVKEALGVDHSWGFQASFVLLAMQEDFMKPVTHLVETLLNTTSVKVVVYNGQLDLIVDTPGTVKWVDNLQFKDSDLWKKMDRKTIIVEDVIEGYYKKLGNLSMYWVNRAGHFVPVDNPAAMHYILEEVTQFTAACKVDDQ